MALSLASAMDCAGALRLAVFARWQLPSFAGQVAAVSGHHLAVPKEATTKKSSPHLLEIFLIAALGLAALGLGVPLLARWLRGGGEAAES